MMGQLLHDWILGLTAAALVAALAQLLTPKGPVEKVTGFVSTVMLIAALLAPLLELDMDTFSWSMAEYRRTVAETTQDMEAQEKRLLRSYIEESCAAYILDEARVLGIADGVVEVSAKWGNETWIPCEASMTMAATSEQKQRLSGWIAAQLGIPEERQRWGSE